MFQYRGENLSLDMYSNFLNLNEAQTLWKFRCRGTIKLLQEKELIKIMARLDYDINLSLALKS